MKKVILMAALSLAAMSAHAECSINSIFTSGAMQEFQRYGQWTTVPEERFNIVCNKLKKANARLSVAGYATVLADRSVGWALLTVQDADTGIGTSVGGAASTYVDQEVNIPTANKMMVLSMNRAMAEWESIDLAIEALVKERQKVKAKYAKR